MRRTPPRRCTTAAARRDLAVSTKIPHELVQYPDSGKVLVRSGPAGAPTSFVYRGHLATPRDYWDGEQADRARCDRDPGGGDCMYPASREVSCELGCPGAGS